MKPEYRCHLRDGKIVYDNPEISAHRGMHAFKEGFWVDRDWKLCSASDDKYWIPPSMILMIEKLDKT
jgi:hypothetical protein